MNRGVSVAEIGHLGPVVLRDGADRFVDDAEISVGLYVASTPTGGENRRAR